MKKLNDNDLYRLFLFRKQSVLYMVKNNETKL